MTSTTSKSGKRKRLARNSSDFDQGNEIHTCLKIYSACAIRADWTIHILQGMSVLILGA